VSDRGDGRLGNSGRRAGRTSRGGLHRESPESSGGSERIHRLSDAMEQSLSGAREVAADAGDRGRDAPGLWGSTGRALRLARLDDATLGLERAAQHDFAAVLSPRVSRAQVFAPGAGRAGHGFYGSPEQPW